MKKILVCLLILVLVVVFLGCAPKTGEAKIKLPKELGEPKDGVYYLSEDWYGKTINFRDCVKVNDETTWVLSKNKNGDNPIKNFTATLGGTYYVVCSDRLGISNSYKFVFNVEDYIYNYFFIDYDYEALYDYALQHFDKQGSSGKLTIIEHNFAKYLYNLTWAQIENNSVVGDSLFYCTASGGSFDEESVRPEKNPTKNGYTFKRWKRVCESKRLNGEPKGESNYQLGGKYLGRTTSYAYVAVWEKK